MISCVHPAYRASLYFISTFALKSNNYKRVLLNDYVHVCADGKYGGKKLFTFEDIFNSTFTPKTFDVQWIRFSGQCDSYDVCY